MLDGLELISVEVVHCGGVGAVIGSVIAHDVEACVAFARENGYPVIGTFVNNDGAWNNAKTAEEHDRVLPADALGQFQPVHASQLHI